MASGRLSELTSHWLAISASPVGMISQVTKRRMVFRPVRSSRVDQGEPAGLLGQPGRVRLATDPGGGERAGPGHHEAAGEHLVARLFDDRVGLAGEQGFVDLQPVGFGDRAVDHDLVARSQFDQIVEDDVGCGDFDRLPVPAYHRSGRAEDGQSVQGSLGPQFLDHPDQGVGDDHSAEEGVLRWVRRPESSRKVRR